MDEDIAQMADLLESLLDDLPFKAKEQLQSVVDQLREDVDSEKLMKIQDELELITSAANIDSFARTEIMKSVKEIESIYNG